jgi:hypothetical protein
MKFKAEQFEAEVTEVGEHPAWVVAAPGHKRISLRRMPVAGFVVELQVLTTDRGWVQVLEGMGDEPVCTLLADAIALLYSVPGVAYVEDVL